MSIERISHHRRPYCKRPARAYPGSSSAPTLHSRALPEMAKGMRSTARRSLRPIRHCRVRSFLGLTMTFVRQPRRVRSSDARQCRRRQILAPYYTLFTFLEPYVRELAATSSLSVPDGLTIDHLLADLRWSAHVISVKIWSGRHNSLAAPTRTW
jgi:hypothetical protein